ncbi:hypothetical protein ABZ604_11680 [Streptomyces sp. NPDC012473]|uniref:hypothetical protein n=1 Tax=Streptomyces sp. NPDC012473 TaxID=3156676 RepID=UPI0033CD6335
MPDMLRIWMRNESRRPERRAALVSNHAYADAGCAIVQPGTWSTHCPAMGTVLGLKELPDLDKEQRRLSVIVDVG